LACTKSSSGIITADGREYLVRDSAADKGEVKKIKKYYAAEFESRFRIVRARHAVFDNSAFFEGENSIGRQAKNRLKSIIRWDQPTLECAFERVKQPHSISNPRANAEATIAKNTKFVTARINALFLHSIPVSSETAHKSSSHGSMIATRFTAHNGRMRYPFTRTANSSGSRILPTAA